MAKRRTFTVASPPGLNIRENPSLNARILSVLKDGEKVKIDPDASTKEWALLDGGGYVMKAYLK